MADAPGKGKSSVPDEKLLAIIDPLGEIRALAGDLWRDQGSPPDKTWRDFWAEAESRLLSGTGSRRAVNTPARQSDPVRHSAQADEVAGDPFLSLLGEAVGPALNLHESESLAYFLRDNEVVLADHSSHGPFGAGGLAGVLAHLAADYDPSFLKAAGADHFSKLALNDRIAYWERIISNLFAKDEPLNYYHQNTVQRFRTALAAHPKVKAIRFAA